MSDFEGQVWAVQDNDALDLVCTVKRQKKKIQALSEKGRELSLAEDKLLWRLPSAIRAPDEWPATMAELRKRLAALSETVDVALLWETAQELETSDLDELVALYFTGETGVLERMALWQAFVADRTHFKRRGQQWETRTPAQVMELRTQREREAERGQMQAVAGGWLGRAARNLESGVIPLDEAVTPFIERLECWLRGDADRDVESLVIAAAEEAKSTPRELVFDILQKIGRIPAEADRDVIVAGLKPEFSVPITEAARAVQPWLPDPAQAVYDLSFSIDDEDTREVDDALSLARDGDLWKLTVAISDPASVVHRGDSLDREAMRRGTTVYLPTQTVLMLPPRVSCDIASLSADQVRSAVLVQVWLDGEGVVRNMALGREAARVLHRLSYAEADRLIAEGTGAMAEELRALAALTDRLRAGRESEGAIGFNRPEYKIHVHDGQVEVTLIERDSISRQLVAETMILANHLAAKFAQRNNVPIIYRTQNPPLEPIDQAMLRSDPLAFQKVRRFIRPSALSLHPSVHSGLGLSCYTQLTSPLRRFADLVMQRQLMAHLIGETPPYEPEELFQVLATAEHTAREAKMVEAEAKKRWFMQYLKQEWQDRPIPALIVEAQKAGYKVEMQPWGVEAMMSGPGGLKPGEIVDTVIEKLRVKAGQARLRVAG